MNSTGAAPVPPSLPSTTMKSGVNLVSIMAFNMANQSSGLPMHILKPTGLPLDFSLKREINSSISIGVLNAVCWLGEMQSSPIGTPLVMAISGVILAAGRMPPCPGFAPCESLISIILI